MAVTITGNTFATADQVTATKLNDSVNSATFAAGAVDNSTTQLSGGAIIVRDGGITTAKLATTNTGTALQVLRVNAGATALEYTSALKATVLGSGTQTTTSSSYVDVSTMSLTMTTTGGDVLLLVSFPINASAGEETTTTINLDGVDGSVLSTSQVAQAIVTYHVYYSSLSAASHTWKLRFRNSASASTSVNMAATVGRITAIQLL